MFLIHTGPMIEGGVEADYYVDAFGQYYRRRHDNDAVERWDMRWRPADVVLPNK